MKTQSFNIKFFHFLQNKYLKIFVFILLISAITLLSIFTFGTSTYKIRGLVFEVSAKPIFKVIRGSTIISFPPFGQLKAKTHKSPVDIQIELKKISTPELKNLAEHAMKNENMVRSFEESTFGTMKKWFIKIILIGMTSAFIFSFLIYRNRLIPSILASFIGLAIVLSLGLSTFYTYNLNGFNQPTYSGMLSAAPWLISTAQQKIKDFTALRNKFKGMINNAGKISKKVNAWNFGLSDNNTIRVLQISDIHNNPIAFDLIKRAASDFNVDAIIDLGDITDYGTELESSFVQKISSLELPYIYVTGNHDSEKIVEEIRTQGNVIILNNSGYNFKGINFYGVNDPGSTSETIAPLNAKQSSKFSTDLKNNFLKMNDRPDVLLIHNPRYASSLFGIFKYILTGHTHKPSLTRKKKTLQINAGTAGGAGIRTFEHEDGVPYSFKILHFKTNPERIMAIDSLNFSGVDQDFELKRKILPNDDPKNKI